MKQLEVLVPPGIGDVHWVLLKLRSWLAQQGARARVHVFEHDRRPRALAYLERVPFITPGRYYVTPKTAAAAWEDPILRRSYDTGELDVAPSFHGYDFFLCFDGSLVKGKTMDEILPDCKTDWRYPVIQRPEDVEGARRHLDGVGRYVLFGLSDYSIFRRWVDQIGRDNLRRLVEAVPSVFGPDCRAVLTGAAWDIPFCRSLSDIAVDLTGQTTVGELLTMIRGAQAFIGFAGGNGIVATHLNCPTLLFWHETYKEPRFRWNWCDPAKVGTLYRHLETGGYDHDLTLNAVKEAWAVTK